MTDSNYQSITDRPKPYEVERDRHGVMYSGPLEVGECIEVVPMSWDGLTMILDRHYPPDVFTGASGDPGPRIVALAREIDRLRAQVAALLRDERDDGEHEGARLVVTLRPYRADWKAARALVDSRVLDEEDRS